MKIAEFFDKHFGGMLGGMAILMVLGLAFGGWKKLKIFSTFFKKTIDK